MALNDNPPQQLSMPGAAKPPTTTNVLENITWKVKKTPKDAPEILSKEPISIAHSGYEDGLS